MFEISTLKEKKISELQKIASDLGIEKISGLKKQDLAYKIIDHYASKPESKEDSKAEIKKDESKNPDIKKGEKIIITETILTNLSKKKRITIKTIETGTKNPILNSME